jgi:anti-sigma factor RsiW
MSGSLSEMEKFELLSAYLDGEVTATERQQVELWLQEDAAFRNMHQRLRSTQHSLAHLPVADEVAFDAFAEGVFAKVEKRRQRNYLKIGGGVVAAALLAVGGSIAAGWEGFTSPGVQQFANVSLPTSVPNSLEIVPNPAPLMVALNKPLVTIQIAPQNNADDLDILDLLDEEI